MFNVPGRVLLFWPITHYELNCIVFVFKMIIDVISWQKTLDFLVYFNNIPNIRFAVVCVGLSGGWNIRVICVLLSIGEKYSLSAIIMKNFLDVMGYWMFLYVDMNGVSLRSQKTNHVTLADDWFVKRQYHQTICKHKNC